MSSLSIDTRVALLENQSKRLVADYESEKENRASINSEIDRKLDRLDDRLRDIEKIVWKGIGIMIAANSVLTVVFNAVVYLIKH